MIEGALARISLIQKGRELTGTRIASTLVAGNLDFSSLTLTETHSDVHVRHLDEVIERRGIHLTAGPELHVPHAFARSLQQSGRIFEQRAVEEPDVDVIFECVDVPEGRVVDAGGRHSVVHQLAHVAATLPHACKPLLHKRSEVVALSVQPAIDQGVALRRRRKSQYTVHSRNLSQVVDGDED
jgi:hypothetical protein